MQYIVELFEGDKKCYQFVKDLPQYYLKKMTTLNPDNAEFERVQYFDLTPLLANHDSFLNCECLQRSMDDKFASFFDCNPTLSRAIRLIERYELVLLSSVVSVRHILRSNYCIFYFFSIAAIFCALLLRESNLSEKKIGVK